MTPRELFLGQFSYQSSKPTDRNQMDSQFVHDNTSKNTQYAGSNNFVKIQSHSLLHNTLLS